MEYITLINVLWVWAACSCVALVWMVNYVLYDMGYIDEKLNLKELISAVFWTLLISVIFPLAFFVWYMKDRC